MPLREEMRKEIEKLGGKPLPREVWEKYQKDMAKNRERYEAEARVRLARTYQLARNTVVV